MEVDVSEDDVMSRGLPFKPQKELKYNQLLPYSEQVSSEAIEYYGLIKSNLNRCLILSEERSDWIYELSKYMRIYGYFFPKEDHILFINLIYEVIQMPTIKMGSAMTCMSVLTTLLKKRELLTREELVIEWRPLYDLYEKYLYSSKITFVLPEGFDNCLKGLIRAARVYFPIEATSEILDEFRHYLCPFDAGMSKGLTYFELFLPTICKPEEQKKGYKLWLDEFMTIWDSNPNSPSWEQSLVWLFARVSHDNIGYIDWTPWIPKIFTHLLKSFNLQGGTHRVQIKRTYQVFEVNAAVLWIVSMLNDKDDVALFHVEALFKSVESFYHPSNIGTWHHKLSQFLSKLPSAIVRRLHRERYKKPTWETPIPKSHQLGDATVTKLTEALTPIINVAMFSRYGSHDSAFALQHLSYVRPEIVIPPLLEKLYASLETVTEPHRLTASIQCAISVTRGLVAGGKYFPEGPSHVIPLLLASLPGIDSNDIRKSMVTFQFISTLATLIPIVDCSPAIELRDDLTDNEKNLCLATAQFENFVLLFMDKCFALIENSAYEHRPERPDNEGIKMTSEEGITQVGLTSTFGSILSQCSYAIMESALNKLHSFVANRIFETKIAGKLVSGFVGKAAKVAPELTCAKFLPHFARLVISLTNSEDDITEEKDDEELLFSLQLLSEICKCDGSVLLKYKTDLMQVLDQAMLLKTKRAYGLVHSICGNILRSLSTIYLLELRCTSVDFQDKNLDLSKTLPIREWGNPGDIDNLNCKFHVPSSDEINLCQELVEKYAIQAVNYLVDWSEKRLMEQPSRDEVRKKLNLIVEVINGVSSNLPMWEGDEVKIVKFFSVEGSKWRVKETGSQNITLKDGRNVREVLATKLRVVLRHMLTSCEDDTKSMLMITKLYHLVMFNFGLTKGEFDMRWKSFHIIKKTLENKLIGHKKHIRPLIMDRIILQHELRIRNRTLNKLTSLHVDMISDLVTLSTSHYSEVRQKAQETLDTAFAHYIYVYRLVVEPVLKLIAKDSNCGHESFKGALHLIRGRKGRSVLTVSDWETLHRVWYAIVNAQYSEKPSIIKLLLQLSDTVSKYYEDIPIISNTPPKIQEIASRAWSTGFKPPIAAPSAEEIEKSRKDLEVRNSNNLKHYYSLIEELVKVIDSHELHWRFVDLGFDLLGQLIRFDIRYPTCGVSLMTKNLISDNLLTRKCCIYNVGMILSTQKRSHVKKWIEVPDRSSNKWLQYVKGTEYMKEEVWKSTFFVFKPYIGYYCYPKNGIKVLDYEKEPRVDRNKNELEPEEIPIFDFFSKQENVLKLIEYLSLEEKKGSDKFNTKRYLMFRGLFRSFGTTFLPLFQTELARLVCSSQESHQRCAAEFIGGLMRGSRHWPYEENVKLRNFVEPLMRSAMDSMIPETVGDWGTCCATCFEREDGRRVSWFVELVAEDPLKGTKMFEEAVEANGASKNPVTSFLLASRIYCLLGVVQQQQWRDLSLLQHLVSYLQSDQHLAHSLQVVRERIGVLLTNIFIYDVGGPCLPGTLDEAPRRDDFINFILPQLEPLLKEPENSSEEGILAIQSPEKKAAANLLKTVAKWIIQNFSKNSCSASTGHYKLLPVLCHVQSEITDEELMTEALFALVIMSHTMLTTEGIICALDACESILSSRSWKARGAIGSFLQYMVSTNLFIIMNNPQWVDRVTKMVLKLLEDERVEVREAGAATFGGLIHCELIKVTNELFNWLQSKSNSKLRKVKNPNNPGLTMFESSDVVSRHAGILGLCSLINAYPYDVPSFMPKVLMSLTDHLHDPAPIPATIKKTMNTFKRTHLDNWAVHKQKFTEDELSELTNILVSPSYYA